MKQFHFLFLNFRQAESAHTHTKKTGPHLRPISRAEYGDRGLREKMRTCVVTLLKIRGRLGKKISVRILGIL